MNKVVGVYQTGAKTQVINGSAISYDNIILHIVTDEIPENMIEGFQGSYTKDVKLKRSVARLVGCTNWFDLVGREVEFGVTIGAKGPQINRVFVQDNPFDDKKQNNKES